MHKSKQQSGELPEIWKLNCRYKYNHIIKTTLKTNNKQQQQNGITNKQIESKLQVKRSWTTPVAGYTINRQQMMAEHQSQTYCSIRIIREIKLKSRQYKPN